MPYRPNSLRRARPLLGTLVEIAAIGPASHLVAAVNASFAAVERVHGLMSFHDRASDVARINAAAPGVEVPVDVQTYAVLARARELSDLSDGVFDVVTAAVLVEKGFLPVPEQLAKPAPGASYLDLELLPDMKVRWQRKGWVDLGGIAKGYAVDCAVAVLRERGMDSAIVNAGGDLRCFGMPQPIHVRSPVSPAEFLTLGVLKDAALATSGGYFAGVQQNGRQIDPLVSPFEQRCVAWTQSISVVATNCMTADAMTKIVRLSGKNMPAMLDTLGAQAIITDGRDMESHGLALLEPHSGVK
jgi:thiamine biosynthesis lipoprotein